MQNHTQLLGDSNLRTTGARLAVLSFFNETAGPLGADEIIEHLLSEHEKVDKATVYRMLETFYQKGLIKRLEFGEGKYRYEIAGEDHHHLICEKCGSVQDLSNCNIPELERDIMKKKKFKVVRHSLEFFGICALCQH
ncbi:MAG: transcriptional repressor [Candidatus Levybacteria bacterium]|nr:transcriptional repressor [Candidatus Levybacteria bacterium]